MSRTPRLRHVIGNAGDQAMATRQAGVGIAHLWLGLLAVGGVGRHVLAALGVDLDAAAAKVRAGIEVGDHGPDPAAVTPEAFREWSQARHEIRLTAEVVTLLHGVADTGQLLLALVRIDDVLGLTEERVRAETERQLAEFMSGRTAGFDPSSADELIAVPRVRVPTRVRELDVRIEEVRQQKETAIEAQEFERAAEIRAQEKELRRERAERVAEWSAGVDVVALAEEVEALRAEVDRLRPDQR